MNARAEMRMHLLDLTAPDRAHGGVVKDAVRRVQRLVGCSAGRARELFYGRAEPSVAEMDRVRAERAAKQRAGFHDEISELRSRIAALEARLTEGVTASDRAGLAVVREAPRAPR